MQSPEPTLELKFKKKTVQCIRDGRHKKSTGKIIHTQNKSVLISPGLFINANHWKLQWLHSDMCVAVRLSTIERCIDGADWCNNVIKKAIWLPIQKERRWKAMAKRERREFAHAIGAERKVRDNRTHQIECWALKCTPRTKEQRTEEQRKMNLFSSSSALARVFECACDRCTNIFLFKLSYLFAYKKNHTLVQEVRELMQKNKIT